MHRHRLMPQGPPFPQGKGLHNPETEPDESGLIGQADHLVEGHHLALFLFSFALVTSGIEGGKKIFFGHRPSLRAVIRVVGFSGSDIESACLFLLETMQLKCQLERGRAEPELMDIFGVLSDGKTRRCVGECQSELTR